MLIHTYIGKFQSQYNDIYLLYIPIPIFYKECNFFRERQDTGYIYFFCNNHYLTKDVRKRFPKVINK